MKNSIVKQLTLTFFSLLISSITWAQSLSGAGTSSNPYKITNADDWKTFGQWINDGKYTDKYYKLTADIGTANNPIRTMVGIWSEKEEDRRPFKGYFYGENHTITIDYEQNPDGKYTAPFVYTDGATINKIRIAGKINVEDGYAAGVIGVANGAKDTKINGANSVISVDITGSNHCGGIAVDGSKLSISSCAYNGKIVSDKDSAGFVAISSKNTTINYCLFAPATGSKIENGENFYIGGLDETHSSNYYYVYNATPAVESTQGVMVYTYYNDVPTMGFWLRKQLYDYNKYYVQGKAAFITDSPYYQISVQNDGLKYIVTFDGTIVNAVNYTQEIKDSDNNTVTVNDIGIGDYTLIIHGKSGYSKGTLSTSITIDDAPLKGMGTADDPYLINNTDDWNRFAIAVTKGHSFLGEFIQLNKDIDVTVNNNEADEIAGGWKDDNVYNAFSGTFDGNWKTMTFRVGTNEPYKPKMSGKVPLPSTPFRVIDGAAIKNMKVVGTITSTGKYNSGFVGFAYNKKTAKTNSLTSCISSIEVDCSNISGSNPDCSSSGFVAENKIGTLAFKYCIFDGKIDKGSHVNAQKSAGYVSYNNTSTSSILTFTDCTMAGIITLTSNYGTYYRAGTAVFSNAYYARDYGGVNGVTGCKKALDMEPKDMFVRKYELEKEVYYVPGAIISGLETTAFSESGEPIVITPEVSYYGWTLDRDEYELGYEWKVGGVYEPVEEIVKAGDYHFIISGKKDGNYGGFDITDIKVVQINGWEDLKNAMAMKNGSFTLYDDFKANIDSDDETALVAYGDITLNLNGHTINRNLTFYDENYALTGAPDKNGPGHVIVVEKGANVKIIGPGELTGGCHKGDDEKIDGAGIYNMGNLTIENVAVTSNVCFKKSGLSASGRGAGIYSGNGSYLLMKDGQITSNSAKGGGGGLYGHYANKLVLRDVDIESNVTESKGGGIRIVTYPSVTDSIINCQISSNFTIDEVNASEGGGVYMEGGNLYLENCDVMGNQSTFAGGGFFSLNGNTTMKDCKFSYNGSYNESLKHYGGGICLYSETEKTSTLTLDGGIIVGNQCVVEGGGIYAYPGSRLFMKGHISIYDNNQGSMMIGDSRKSNLYLADNGDAGLIYIIDRLDKNSIIGVAKARKRDGSDNHVFTKGLEGDDYGAFGLLANFVSDDTKYSVVPREREAALGILNIWDPNVPELPEGVSDVGTHDYVVSLPVMEITGEIKANSVSIVDDGCLIIDKGGVLISNKFFNKDSERLVINDGGQIIVTNKETIVNATVKKNILNSDAWSGNNRWYMISSAVSNPKIKEGAASLITRDGFGDPSYDLYRFNESAVLQWENYRNTNHTDFDALTNGRGYLYRNGSDMTINIEGILNVEDVDYVLSRTEEVNGNPNKLAGFNIIGNPFSHDITKGKGGNIENGKILSPHYYILNTDGTWQIQKDGSTIPPLTGIMVQALQDEAKLIISNKDNLSKGVESDDEGSSRDIWFTVSGNGYKDVSCVRLDEGCGMNKLAHQNAEAPMLYIPYKGENFAYLSLSQGVKRFDLNFEAKKTGRFTISYDTKEEFAYLHLIDKILGKDIDLLSDGEYTFMASPVDIKDRFEVRLNLSNKPEGFENIFAYQSGGDIVVSGEGELQIFDVMGRLVATQRVTGVETVRKPSSSGVYILRLNEMSQKIVVR